jgi:hypothetical protein
MIRTIRAEQAKQTVTIDGYGQYDVDLELRWKLIHGKVVEVGIGRAVGLSGSGILFDAGRTLPVGFDVELSICWPVLHNMAPLQLVVLGRIVRSEGQRVVLRMIRHEFRTAIRSLDHRQMPAAGVRAPSSMLASVNRMARVVKQSGRASVDFHRYPMIQ